MSKVLEPPAADGILEARPWPRALLALTLALAALAVPLWQTGESLLALWMDNASYGHGILILPISFYLLWLRRRDFEREVPRPSFVGVLALGGLMAAWLGSRILGILMGEQLVLVGLAMVLPLALFGARVARLSALPVLYLLCAIPVWSYLVPWLQMDTANISTAIARSLGVPIFLDGLYMSIPDGQFVVAQACAGLRYLLAALSLGGFYALLNLQFWWTRVLLLAACFLMGIVFNWIRVVGIILIGHHSQMQSPLVHSHVEYGWVLFVLVVLGVLVLGRLLEKAEARRPLPASGPDAPPREGSPRGQGLMVATAATALLALAPAALADWWLQLPGTPVRVDLASVSGAGGWVLAPRSTDGWHPVYTGSDASTLETFRRGDDAVDVFVAYYVTQRQDAEAVNEKQRVFNRESWRPYSLEAVPTAVEMAPGVSGEEFLVYEVDGGGRRLVWRTAWINGRYTVDRVQAKVQQLLGLFTGRRAAAGLVVSVPLGRDEDQARARLREFLNDVFPRLEEAMQRVESGPRTG